MRTEIRISVRALMEFILREGDLDSRTTGKTDLLAMQAGGRLHRKIQRRMGAGYQAEVPLKTRVSMGEFDCVVEGRADGIFAEDGLVYIDEIKGVYRDLNLIGEPVGVHLAQALCYACIYAEREELPEIGVQLTYGNLETEELKYFRETRTREELREWFFGLMKEYEKWAGFQYEWKKLRKASMPAFSLWNSLFPTGRARGSWRRGSTGRLPGRSGCSSRPPQESARRFPRCFRR